MGKRLIVDLTDDEFDAAEDAAVAAGATAADWVARIVRAHARSNGDVGAASPRHAMPEASEIPLKTEAEFRAEYEEIFRRTAEREAARYGGTMEEHLARFRASIAPKPACDISEAEREAAFERMSRHFGSVATGDPHSADNDRIDADLAREYAKDLDQEV